jgi:hypothetical protein
MRAAVFGASASTPTTRLATAALRLSSRQQKASPTVEDARYPVLKSRPFRGRRAVHAV